MQETQCDSWTTQLRHQPYISRIVIHSQLCRWVFESDSDHKWILKLAIVQNRLLNETRFE